MTRTTIAVAAALLMGTATVAMAGDGSRPAKRSTAAMQSTPMRVNQPTNMSMPTDNLIMNVMDRASAPFACGG